jgi:hypothetical protein
MRPGDSPAGCLMIAGNWPIMAEGLTMRSNSLPLM